MITNERPIKTIDEEQRRKLELFNKIKKSHLKAVGHQVVDSDTLIFLISELNRFYFPSE